MNVCPSDVCGGGDDVRTPAGWASLDDVWYCPQCGEPCPEGGVHEACKAAFAASARDDAPDHPRDGLMPYPGETHRDGI